MIFIAAALFLKLNVAFLQPAKQPKVKEILKQYAAYNVWANQTITEVILAQPYEVQVREVTSSFRGLHLTLYHMWFAEDVWWQRIKLAENVQPPEVDKNNVHALAGGLMKQSRLWEEWVAKTMETNFEHEFVYRNSKKEQFKQPVYQVLLHMFNHQAYHRGQLVTMLRQLGVEKIGSTDFIEFTRRKK